MDNEHEAGLSPDIHLYDNTLREGEQTIGIAFSTEDKVRIAEQLVKTGIRHFEVGFAVVSEGERDAIRAIVDKDLGASLYSLSRLRKEDVDHVIDAGLDRIAIFAPSSDSMIEARMHGSVKSIERGTSTVVEYAKSKGLFVRFGCEDATRSPIERLIRLFTLARDAGADYMGLADTAGVIMPDRFCNILQTLKREIGIPISIHCHNDLGLAVANSVIAARCGADEIQVTVNGLGERAGNAIMDELVMAMKVGYGIDLGVDLAEMANLSRMVTDITGLEVAFNKPIMGKHAFMHESGIHVHGLMREDLETYQPFDPELVGRKHRVAFGKHSGRSNVRFLCRELGVSLDPESEKEIVNRIKKLALNGPPAVPREDVAAMIMEDSER